jgi:hypothetical protein
VEGREGGSGFRRARNPRLGRFFNCTTFSSGLCLPVSGAGLLPPSASISLLTAAIHESISSALSRTRRKLVAVRRYSAPRKVSLDRRDLESAAGVPSASIDCEICKTQCRPGMTSLANATESFPSCSIFSGSRSNAPSPEY